MDNSKSQEQILDTKQFHFEIISKINEGLKIEDLAKKNNTDCMTIRNIYNQNANEYIQFNQQKFRNNSHFAKWSEKFSSKEDYLNYLLCRWCKQQKKVRILVTKDMLKKHAVIIHDLVYATGKSEASESWYEEFAQKFGIENLYCVDKISNNGTQEALPSKKLINHNDCTLSDIFRDLLCSWFSERKSAGISITNYKLKNHALLLYNTLNVKEEITDFDSWYSDFKLKCGLDYINDSCDENYTSNNKQMILLNKTLCRWLKQQKKDGISLNKDMIRAQAILLHEQLKIMNKFEASDDWYEMFKIKYCIDDSYNSAVIIPDTTAEQITYLIEDDEHVESEEDQIIYECVRFDENGDAEVNYELRSNKNKVNNKRKTKTDPSLPNNKVKSSTNQQMESVEEQIISGETPTIPDRYMNKKKRRFYNLNTKVPHEPTAFKNPNTPLKRSHLHTNQSSFENIQQPILDEETSSTDEKKESFLTEQYSSYTDDFIITNVRSCVDEQSPMNEEQTSEQPYLADKEHYCSTENLDMDENEFSEQLQCFDSMVLAELKQIKSERILRKLKLRIIKSIYEAQEEDAELN